MWPWVRMTYIIFIICNTSTPDTAALHRNCYQWGDTDLQALHYANDTQYCGSSSDIDVTGKVVPDI